MKELLQRVIGPIAWRSVSSLRSVITRPNKQGAEQPPDFYDRSYHKRGHWKVHYTESHYYPLWTVIADRIRRVGPQRILDIGCGPGQVACLMRDIGVPEYKGLDFSVARVARARAVCPEYDFVAADVFESDSLDTYPYDCVLMMEFLEHIERDIDVLQRVRAGTIVLATVPNFPAAGHVRHFASAREVEARYGAVFERLDVSSILANKRGSTYYVLQAAR